MMAFVTFVSRTPLALAVLALAACQSDLGSGAGDDASSYAYDASSYAYPSDATAGSLDAGGFAYDAGVYDAATNAPLDGSYVTDAGITDAGRDATANGDASTGCSGGAPHGCYVAKADNDKSCPPQIHEQSAYYPPMNEWTGCSSPLYQNCNYTKPDGSLAFCSCDFGLHWLCTY